MQNLCEEEKLAALVRVMQAGEPDQVERIQSLVAEYPEDPRLQFMLGSALIGDGRLIEGHRSLTRAVELAPEFAIARFQLGFFQLTSGEAESALETWGRIDRLPDGHYLRRFVDGLRCLIRDDFRGAIDNLRQGISLNDENPPLSRDMQLIIDQTQALIGAQAQDGPDGEASETSFALSQFSKRTDS